MPFHPAHSFLAHSLLSAHPMWIVAGLLMLLYALYCLERGFAKRSLARPGWLCLGWLVYWVWGKEL